MTFHPSPVAPVAPQLQPRISTSLTDVTLKFDGENPFRLRIAFQKVDLAPTHTAMPPPPNRAIVANARAHEFDIR
jgi:hypothetical protein